MDKTTKIIKIALAVFLFLCLAKMPYGYYEFVRFIAMVGFAYLAITSNVKTRQNEVFIFVGLAILFQPFFKIALGRELWNVVDLVVGVGLIASVFIKRKDSRP